VTDLRRYYRRARRFLRKWDLTLLLGGMMALILLGAVLGVFER
jgi:hypothetical protein